MQLGLLHLTLWAWLCTSACAATSSVMEAPSLEGRLVFPLGTRLPDPSKIQVVLLLQGGHQRRAYATANATFTFHRVPAGLHVLEPSCVGYIAGSVKLNLSSTEVAAVYLDHPEQTLLHPLVIHAAQVDYFDRVNRLDVLAFLKSPMGLLAAFMAFAMLISPYLKVDPEELQAYQNELKETQAAKALKASRAAEVARQSAATLMTAGGTTKSGGGFSSARQRNRK